MRLMFHLELASEGVKLALGEVGSAPRGVDLVLREVESALRGAESELGGVESELGGVESALRGAESASGGMGLALQDLELAVQRLGWLLLILQVLSMFDPWDHWVSTRARRESVKTQNTPLGGIFPRWLYEGMRNFSFEERMLLTVRHLQPFAESFTQFRASAP
jgi:hypothetical protein